MAFGSTELAIKSRPVSAVLVAFTGHARVIESGYATSLAASDPRSALLDGADTTRVFLFPPRLQQPYHRGRNLSAF